VSTAGIRWLISITAAAGLLGLGALGVPAASAASAPPTLNGEALTIPVGSGATSCISSGSFSATVSGTATGPYPGTFSEAISGTVGDGEVTAYTDSFTITSATGDVTGTETLASSAPGDGCYQDSSNFLVYASADYQATIQASGGNYTDQGTTSFTQAVVAGSAVVSSVEFTSSQAQTTPVAVPTTTTVASSANPSVPGQKVTYTATVSPTDGGGSVTFSDGGSPITGCTGLPLTSSGQATCPVTYKATGSHTITAAYSGDSGYAPSPSGPLTQTVVPDRADLKITLSVPSTAADGASMTQTVTVTNQGPATASRVVTTLTEPGGLTVSSAGGAAVHRCVLTWDTASLAPGSSLIFTVTAKVSAHARGSVLVAAGTLSATPDPDPFNNAAVARVRLG
jgi:Bacterial Ig-like domain (group 3)/Domain of unknown function DUF11